MLTETQRKVMLHLQDYMKAHDGIAPSLAEMATALSIKSSSGLHATMLRLEERGYIRRIKGKARALEIVRRVRR